VGRTVERGYGGAHQELRRRWAAAVAAGIVDCARCGEKIFPGAKWDLGHVDGDRSRYSGPEHARCNRASAARRRNRGYRRLTPEERALQWAARYEADQERLERERRQPAIY
jgi:hypothetical protein